MSGSLNSLTKGLQTIFSSGTTEISNELLELIDSYKDKHSPPSDTDRSRLHDDLLQVHRQYVNAENSAAFLHILTLLKHDFIIEPDACACWWSLLLSPILNHSELLKATLKDSLSICLDTLVFKDDDPDFKTRYAAAERLKSCIFESYFEAANKERQKVTENLQSLLIAFARRRTQDFFEFADSFLQNPKYRLQSLTLLSTFVRLQTQYIYKIAETSLLRSLLLCLQHDASTTVVSLALTVLIMIFPHIPDRLGQMLPQLFHILGRILCWDRLEAVQRRTAALVDIERPGERRASIITDVTELAGRVPHEEGAWQRLDASFDIAHSTPPKCAQYFTFLYGMYPVNLLEYVRAASRYVTPSTLPNADEVFDDDTIRSRAEPFVRRHLVHPNFTVLDSDSERSDASRWMKLEPSDVVTMCISLDTINVEPQSLVILRPRLDADVETLILDETEVPPEAQEIGAQTKKDKLLAIEEETSSKGREILLDKSLTEHFDAGSSSRLASPAFLPKLIIAEQNKYRPVSRGSSTSRRSYMSPTEMLKTHEELIDNGLATVYTAEPPFSTQKLDVESSSSTSFYQRELLLLRNELNFERHLKQQHLQHIGRLQRDVISDAALESERQNLYSTTRALKAQVKNLQGVLQRLRSETATAKANRATYEAGLNDRIKRLREEKTLLQQNESELHKALELAKNDVNNMQVSLGVAEGTTFNLQQQLQILEPEIQETKDLQKNFELLRARIKEAEVQDIQLRMEKERVIEAQARAKTSALEAEALREQLRELETSAQRFNNAHLSETSPALPVLRPEMEPIIKMLTDKAEGLSVPFEALKERHSKLLEDHMNLRLKASELEADLESLRLSTNHRLGVQQRPPAPRRVQTTSMSIGAPDKTSISELAAPSVSTTAAYGNVGNEGILSHGLRRLDLTAGGVEDKQEEETGLLTTNTLEQFRGTTGAKSSTSSRSTASAKKENKDKTILGGRFRW